MLPTRAEKANVEIGLSTGAAIASSRARRHALEIMVLNDQQRVPEMVATSETYRRRPADRLGAWQALESHYEGMRNRQMRDLFARACPAC